MREFISKYADRIHGVLSCFDRMLFRGYLPIMSGWQMAQFFNNSNIRYRQLKPFLLEHAARVKQHGVDLAQKEGRPFHYLQEKVRKEELARQIAERDHIEDGLICVLSVLEPCRTFSFRTEKGKPFVGFRTPQVPVSLLLLHGPRLRLDPRQAANLVSSSDTGVRQRTRVARPKAEGEWNPLYETGERIPLDRGHGPSSGVLRPLCFTGVAPDTRMPGR